mmetsp:Transcript_10031/g.11552  ORF Transcript_10031/g.11552 Transcript_10031/m.11552 type:complete len:245 (-) Transcript_10031:2622-3356(-)
MAKSGPGSDSDSEDGGLGIFNPDMFASEVAEEIKTYRFLDLEGKDIEVCVNCVHEENQFIESFVSRVVWPSSEELAQYFCSAPEKVKGLKVLELGSGTGLCALVVAKLGAASVLLTDYSDEAIDVIRKSILRNELIDKCQVSKLSWGTIADNERILTEFDGHFDVCIGTDVVYEPESVCPMFESAFALLKPNGKFYLANHVHRYAGLEDTVKECAKDMKLYEESMKQLGEGISFSIFNRDVSER